MLTFREFAKVFEDPYCSQILVQRIYDADEEKAAISLTVFSMDSGATCTTTIHFDFDDNADNFFNNITASEARVLITPLLDAITRLFPATENN